MPTPRSSSADLGGTTADLLKPIPWTEEEQRQKERAAGREVVRRYGSDCAELLEMLGLKSYESFVKPRNKKSEPEHGKRSTYVNYNCGREGSPPCPASPTCTEAHNAYYRDRRASQAVA